MIPVRETRLRYVSAKKPAQLQSYLRKLGFRVYVIGAPQWDGNRWTLWLIPPEDIRVDVKSIDLAENYK